MSIKPTREKIYIKNLGKELYLNFMSLADEEWIQERFPEGLIKEMAKGGKEAVEGLLSVFWRVMDNDSKRIILSIKMVKWEGVKEIPVDSDDPIERLRYVVSGSEEVNKIFDAIIRTNQKSQPETSDTEKKNLTAAES